MVTRDRPVALPRGTDGERLLTAEVRSVTGKKVKRLRAQGKIPAIVYGRGIPSTPLQLDGRELREFLAQHGQHGLSSLLRLRTVGDGAEPRPVLVQKVARDPVTGSLLHIDFHQIDLDRPVQMTVPVVVVGKAPATDAGGVLVHGPNVVEIECLPGDLPAQLELDVTRLAAIDDALYVRNLQPPPGVTVLTDPDEMLVRVVPTRVVLELATEAAAAAGAAEAEREAEAPAADQDMRGRQATPGAPPTTRPTQKGA